MVPERVMHNHKGEPRNNGYYMRREYNIDLLNEIFLLVNVTLFTGFLRGTCRKALFVFKNIGSVGHKTAIEFSGMVNHAVKICNRAKNMPQQSVLLLLFAAAAENSP